MEREVFSDPDVIKLSRNVITMRLDLTRSQPFHDEVMRKYQIRGIPTAVFINRQGIEEESLRAIGFVGKDEFLKKLRVLLEKT
jgi:thiol:disulfide interchange protein DsbD